tara:strand:+ start:234 stop:455 length:222 start_codon:yes stop_codon:yes gene_type:complete
MKIAFSKEEVHQMLKGVEMYAYEIEKTKMTFEWKNAPFTDEERNKQIKISNDKLIINKRLIQRLEKKIREWKE